MIEGFGGDDSLITGLGVGTGVVTGADFGGTGNRINNIK